MPVKRYLPTRIQSVAILLTAVVGILTATPASTAFAHEGRAVGNYILVVGFLQEPAYEGQLNAVSLVVTKPSDEATRQTQDAKPEDDHHHGDQPADDHHHADDADTAEATDVTVHGAIFTSDQIGMDEEFEFDITEEFGGIEIPYHVHPGDQEGVIVVSTKKADHGHDRSIEIMDDHVVPDRLEVMIGDTVVWENQEAHAAVVMSGTLSPVTTDMTAQMVNDTPDDETLAARARVTGLASDLKVEISHLPTAVSRVLSLTELVDDPGHYVAEFVPTAPGDYRVRFFGSIEGNAIDQTFDSGPDTYDTVIASDAIQFPVVLESNREIQNATRGALDAVQDLETDLKATSSDASTGMIIGIIGIVFGTIAIGISVYAITIARRRN